MSQDFGGNSSLEASRLESNLRLSLADRWPLIFTGAELYGPDPSGEVSSEVLLGRGAVVLLDPPENANKALGTKDIQRAFYEWIEMVIPLAQLA